MKHPTLASLTSGLAGYDPDTLSVRAAQDIIGKYVTAVTEAETVTLLAALDRVLGVDIISPIHVPAHDNSAMDGYALRGADLRADTATVLAIVGTTYAGRPTDAVPGPGQCVRIMTGGVIPAGCDSVIPQERVVQVNDTAITIAPGTLRTGENRRLAGEDLQAGQPALKKGKVLRPADLGLLASLGIARVPVQRRLRVAVFSTGDELRAIGEPLDAGCVHDSNRYTLYGMLTRLGCEVIDMGIVRDEPQALRDALREASLQADAIITSGGVSAGAADFTRQIMHEMGDVQFWKLAMRPGRPLAFGRIAADGHQAYLFGLPGNPVAVMVSFYCFARAALLAMMGAHAPPLLIQVKAAEAIHKKPGRTEFQRGILSVDARGQQSVGITGDQGSGILRSMSEANCLVLLAAERGNVAVGEMVEVLLLEGLV
jgi:molybdopterin molybdotransferase